MYKSKVLDDIRLLYPMVSDITVEYRSSNTVFIQLTFVPIDMIVRNQDVRFALIGTTFLPIYS
ncbi:TPA: hypothetical protein DCZ39_08880 [Patescibacteria group bacterium]|nr:hypothetical protein [Candidatus Gracilibacteria bacterium]